MSDMQTTVRRNLHAELIGRAVLGGSRAASFDVRTSVVVSTDADGIDVVTVVTADQWRQNSHKLPNVFGWRNGEAVPHGEAPAPFTVVAAGTATLLDPA